MAVPPVAVLGTLPDPWWVGSLACLFHHAPERPLLVYVSQPTPRLAIPTLGAWCLLDPHTGVVDSADRSPGTWLRGRRQVDETPWMGWTLRCQGCQRDWTALRHGKHAQRADTVRVCCAAGATWERGAPCGCTRWLVAMAFGTLLP